MKRLGRIVAFTAGALAVLCVGLVATGAIGMIVYHRYDHSNLGVYYGLVRAQFSPSEFEYGFSFEGKSVPRLCWRPTNFAYPELVLNWGHWDDEVGGRIEGHAVLRLPSFQYHSTSSTGLLTPEILAKWLGAKLEKRVSSTNVPQDVATIFGYLEAAGKGTLPRPNHHGIRTELPVRMYMQHFQLGMGFNSLEILWLGAWIAIVALTGRKVFRKDLS